MLKAAELDCYHGTDADAVSSIKQNNFYASEGEDEWLGHGVYFFTSGLGCPREHAKTWAICESYCNIIKRNKYSRYAVLNSRIITERLFDATTPEGQNVFNSLRSEVIAKTLEHFAKGRNLKSDNCFIWNFIADFLSCDVVATNLYIQNKVERVRKISSNVPNCTVVCVKKTERIKKDLIEVVFEGLVN